MNRLCFRAFFITTLFGHMRLHEFFWRFYCKGVRNNIFKRTRHRIFSLVLISIVINATMIFKNLFEKCPQWSCVKMLVFIIFFLDISTLSITATRKQSMECIYVLYVFHIRATLIGRMIFVVCKHR